MDTDLVTIQATGASRLSKKQWGLLTGVSPRRWPVKGNWRKLRGGIKIKDAHILNIMKKIANYEWVPIGRDEDDLGEWYDPTDTEFFRLLEEEAMSRNL